MVTVTGLKQNPTAPHSIAHRYPARSAGGYGLRLGDPRLRRKDRQQGRTLGGSGIFQACSASGSQIQEASLIVEDDEVQRQSMIERSGNGPLRDGGRIGGGKR